MRPQNSFFRWLYSGLLALFSVCPLVAGIAPEFNGQFPIEISRIDEVTVEAERIVLKGSGSPSSFRSLIAEPKASAGPSNSSAPALQIFIFKSTWKKSGRSWKACIEKMENLRTFHGTATALDAGWGTYSHSIYFVTCSDLVGLKRE